MTEFVASNWLMLVIGALIALILLYWALLARRRTRVSVERRDALDEGSAPAARNQALIDLPPAATPLPLMMPEAVEAEGLAAAAGEVLSTSCEPDDLTQIKGLGPRLATTLQGLGVTSIGQIAAWNDSDIERIDAQLGRFQGRIRRDAWVEQARLLAAGDLEGFEAKFGAQ